MRERQEVTKEMCPSNSPKTESTRKSLTPVMEATTPVIKGTEVKVTLVLRP